MVPATSSAIRIAALNLLLGWTFIGWIGALVWASKFGEESLPKKKKKRKRKKRTNATHHPDTHSDLARRLAELAPPTNV